MNEKDQAPHCVQCGHEMLYGTDVDKFVPVCTNPSCPNLGLLQMGIEKITEILEGRANNDHNQSKQDGISVDT
uniref:Uncharacterized protein n=1 Tax=viral metagenome TaxID=1070528 RepID=A0A6H1ZY97_9ZZZZ